MSGLSRAEQALVEAMDDAPMLDRVLRWAAINSGTGNLVGLKALAGELAEAFAVLPGDLTLVDPDPVERVAADGRMEAVGHGQHLLLRVRPEAERRVLLTGHMDTVFAVDHVFQSCRWIDAGTLNGPGTADMKGGLALMLAALGAFEGTGPRLGYDLLINSDEETGSHASARLLRDLSRGKVAALTYEPALPGGGMARARPGSGNFAAIVTGRAAHAGRNPGEGRNALVAAADMALKVARAGHERLSVNPARIDGGGPDNMVPALAILRFNMRPRGVEEEAEGRRILDEIVAGTARTHEVSIHLHGSFSRPPKPVTPETERLFALVKRSAADLGEALGWADTGGVCDGNIIASCGVPVIDTMGAEGGAIHTGEEYLLTGSLASRARLSALVLHRIDREGRLA